MTTRNNNWMSLSTNERRAGHSAPAKNAMLELALDLWLSEMSGSSDETAHMAARVAQLDHRPVGARN